MSTELMESVKVTAIGGGGPFTYTEFQEADAGDESPTISLGTGLTRRRGVRKVVVCNLLTAQAFLDLQPEMDLRRQCTVELIRAGGTNKDVYTPGLFTVTPLVSVIPDTVSVAYAPADTGGPPDGVGWIQMGRLLEGSTPEFTAGAPSDAVGLPLYNNAALNHVMQFPFAVQPGLLTIEEARTLLDVALIKPDGTFTLYMDVFAEILYMPSPAPDTHSYFSVRFFNTAQSFSDLVFFPIGAEDHFYGARLSAHFFGYRESDFHTPTPSF